MNTVSPGPLAADWLRLLAVVGIEILILTAGLWLLARLKPWPIWRRTAWRVGLLGAGLITALEFGGASRFASAQLFRSDAPPRPAPALNAIVRVNLEPTMPAMAPEPIVHNSRAPSLPTAPVPQPLWWPLGLWFAGTALLLVRMAGARLVFELASRHRSHPGPIDIAMRLKQLAQRLGVRQRVRLITMEGLAAPVSFGVFKPTIAVPEDIGAASASTQDAMLAHELAHVAARDALWHGLGDLLVAFLWWHPGVWWLRSEMLAATEMAADDASTVVENGPQVLAECLVSTARRLVTPAGAGWQGMHGGRFRSGLGRRVERLLKADAASFQMASPWQRVLGRGAAVLLLSGIAFLGALLAPNRGVPLSWSESWQGSIGGLLTARATAADAGTVTPSTSPTGLIRWQRWSKEAVADARAAGRPVLVFFTADWAVSGAVIEQTVLEAPEVRRRLEELQFVSLKADATLATNPAIDAELRTLNRGGVPMMLVYSAKPEAPPEILPDAPTPLNVLGAIARANIDPPSPPDPSANSKLPVPTHTPATAATSLQPIEESSSSARTAAINKRLDSIILESFGGTMTLSTAVELLAKAVFKVTANRQAGFGFAIAPPNSDPITELTESGVASTMVRFQLTTVRIEPHLHNASLRHVLEAIVEGSGGRVGYTIQSYGVLFTRKGPPPDPRSRWTQTDLNQVERTLRDRINGRGSSTNGDPLDAFHEDFLGYVHQYGVVATRETPPSDLRSRWTEFDLDQIGRMLRDRMAYGRVSSTNASPAEAFLEDFQAYLHQIGIPVSPREAGWQMYVGQRPNQNKARLMMRAPQEILDRIEQALHTLRGPLPQVLLDVRFVEMPTEVWQKLGIAPPESETAPNSGLSPFIARPGSLEDNQISAPAIRLTTTEARAFTRALNGAPGVKPLTAPRITTLAGRRAQIQIQETRTNQAPWTLPDGTLDTNQMSGLDEGQELQILPVVQPDGITLLLTVTARVREFIGYDLDSKRMIIDRIVDRAPPSLEPRTLPPVLGPYVDKSRRGYLYGGSTMLAGNTPQPLIRHRQLSSRARIWDGQTVVLSTSVEQLRFIGTRTKGGRGTGLAEMDQPILKVENIAKRPGKTTLVVTVTARIIDPAGNPIHSEAQIPPGVPEPEP